MPQLQDTASFIPQLFWLAVTFITLYFLMAKVALPKIGAVIDERQRRIDENLDKAAQLKAGAESAVAAYEKALSESRAHAQTVIKETSDRLSHHAEERNREMGTRLAEQIKTGEARIAAARDQALANVRDIAQEVAEATLSRLLGDTVEPSKVKNAVSTVLKEQGR